MHTATTRTHTHTHTHTYARTPTHPQCGGHHFKAGNRTRKKSEVLPEEVSFKSGFERFERFSRKTSLQNTHMHTTNKKPPQPLTLSFTHINNFLLIKSLFD